MPQISPQLATNRAIEAVWRIEAAKLIAGLTKMTRDVGLAEELAQDALLTALSDWPAKGIPANPGGWLMQTAKRRAIDQFRRRQVLARNLPEMTHDAELKQDQTPDYDTALDDDVKDNVLSLIFTACHPVLTTEARVALTLRLLGGLTTSEIARTITEVALAKVLLPFGPAIVTLALPFSVAERSGTCWY